MILFSENGTMGGGGVLFLGGNVECTVTMSLSHMVTLMECCVI